MNGIIEPVKLPYGFEMAKPLKNGLEVEKKIFVAFKQQNQNNLRYLYLGVERRSQIASTLKYG